MSYAVRNDGLGWRAVNGPDDVSVYETYSAEQPPPPQPPQPDHVQQVKAQIDAIERETLMNRAAREFLLEQAVRETTRDYNIDLTTTGNRELVQDGLYNGNLGYRKVKDIDNQIAALRAQIGAA